MNSEKLKLDVCLSPGLISNYELDNTSIIIIDIVRASTTIATALNYGVDHIIALDDIEATRKLKKEGYLIAGERNGDKIDGFDFGNSPITFMDRKLEGKKLAMTTTNGTRTIQLAKEATEKFKDAEILIGAFVNYSKLRRYLFSGSKNVLLVCSGWKNNLSVEDSIFAGKLADDLMKSNKYKFTTDAASHAILVFGQAKANLFDFIMDYSVRFREKIGQLSQDIRYCLKEDVVEVIPILSHGKFIRLKE